MRDEVEVSVIIPCYNEEAVLGECQRRVSAVLDAMGIAYECVYVDDGSSDNTWLQLRAMQEASGGRVVAVSLSRNFGHQPAVSAGLTLVRGKAVVILDADLQDPPELIPEMVKMWRAGSEVVYGVRESRAGETGFKVWTARKTSLTSPWSVGSRSSRNRPEAALSRYSRDSGMKRCINVVI